MMMIIVKEKGKGGLKKIGKVGPWKARVEKKRTHGEPNGLKTVWKGGSIIESGGATWKTKNLRANQTP